MPNTNHAPAYLENFIRLYAKIHTQETLRTNPHIQHISWNMSIFSHAVKKKEFGMAQYYLDETAMLLERLPQDSEQEVTQKLVAFIKNLQSQFDKFLINKKAEWLYATGQNG